MASIIEVDRLTKTYAGGVTAVNKVSFEVEEGEIFGFLGPNGAGKSTTIMMLTTLIRPTSGRAGVAGFDVVKEPDRVRLTRRIGFLNKMLSAPISRAAIPIGKMTAIALQSIIQVLIIAVIANLLGVRFSTGIFGLLLMVLITTLFAFAMVGLSLSLAIFVKTPEGLHPILNFLTMPLMFTSNAIFPQAAMPAWLKAISAWNPLSYAVTPMRALAGEGWVWEKIIPGLVVTFLFALIMVFIATRQFKRSIA